MVFYRNTYNNTRGGNIIENVPAFSLSKKFIPSGLFRIYMIKWFWVMKDAGTRETGPRPGGVCCDRPTGTGGAFTAENRCGGGL